MRNNNPPIMNKKSNTACVWVSTPIFARCIAPQTAIKIVEGKLMASPIICSHFLFFIFSPDQRLLETLLW